MKKSTTMLKTLTTGILILCLTSAFSQQTADTLANQKTKCILQYLSSLSTLPDNKVISGQWMNNRGLPETAFTEFDTAITAIYNQTSKWVGIIGTDYNRQHTSPYYTKIENMYEANKPLINYFNQNGLVAVMATFRNPWNDTFQGDTTNSSNLLDIVTLGHPANIHFKKQLDSIAKGFSQLQDSNVTVLFRPFHEMNGFWFWWGSKSSTLPVASDFITLWQYVFNYFTITKNLHNILWYYTPSIRESIISNPAFKTEIFYYPGNDYVDVIGLDAYNDTLDIPNYSTLVAMGKPIGLSEFGPKKTTVQNNPFVYDYTILINQIKNKYPALCHWLSWNHFYSGTNWIFYSLATQNNTTALLNDTWVVNRDEIDYSACLTVSINEINNSNSINIYPNPFSTQTTLQTGNLFHNATLTVYNLYGQTVKEIKNISGQTITIFRNNLPSGLYVIRLTENNKVITTNKLIITD